MHQIKFLVDKKQLCIEFSDEIKQKTTLASLEKQGVYLLQDAQGLRNYFIPYIKDKDCGFFISEQGRMGLLFPSEESKFFFINQLGLPSESYLDMGPGYDNQLHFNTDVFCYVDQQFLMTRAQEESYCAPNPY